MDLPDLCIILIADQLNLYDMIAFSQTSTIIYNVIIKSLIKRIQIAKKYANRWRRISYPSYISPERLQYMGTAENVSAHAYNTHILGIPKSLKDRQKMLDGTFEYDQNIVEHNPNHIPHVTFIKSVKHNHRILSGDIVTGIGVSALHCPEKVVLYANGQIVKSWTVSDCEYKDGVYWLFNKYLQIPLYLISYTDLTVQSEPPCEFQLYIRSAILNCEELKTPYKEQFVIPMEDRGTIKKLFVTQGMLLSQ